MGNEADVLCFSRRRCYFLRPSFRSQVDSATPKNQKFYSKLTSFPLLRSYPPTNPAQPYDQNPPYLNTGASLAQKTARSLGPFA
jgi:hypothetical protein